MSNYTAVESAVRNFESVIGNSMRADASVDTMPGTGRLNDDDALRLRADVTHARSVGEYVYVVFSYGTPIAWANENTGPGFVTAQRFSGTTSRHQALVRRAWGL